MPAAFIKLTNKKSIAYVTTSSSLCKTLLKTSLEDILTEDFNKNFSKELFLRLDLQ